MKTKEQRLKDYEDFYLRTFKDIDIKELYSEGAGTNINHFKKITQTKLNQDYFNVMFTKKQTLGKEIFKRYFENENIEINQKERIIVRAGKQFTYNKKTYRGGMFIPKKYFY